MMNISACTHLITTARWYGSARVLTRIEEAKQNKKCQIVSIDWLLDSYAAKKPLAATKFLIGAQGSKRPVPSTSDSVSNATRKRKLISRSGDSEGRRTKGGTDRVLVNLDKISASADKEIPAKGRNEHVVYVDGDDVVWDATLVEPSSALDESTEAAKLSKSSAKIIRIKLFNDTQRETYHTIIRETSSAETPTETRKGDGSLQCAMADFEAAFKKFTGLNWNKRQEQFKKWRSFFIRFDNKESLSWQSVMFPRSLRIK